MSTRNTKQEQLKTAKDPTTSPEVLVELFRNNTGIVSLAVRLAVALNPSTPSEFLGEVLLCGDSIFLQCAAAENPSTPSAALDEALQASRDPKIVYYVAKNPSTSAGALVEYRTKLANAARNSDPRLRRSAVTNEFMPRDALAGALHDKNLLVRWRAAMNPSIPVEALATASRIVRWPLPLLKFFSFDAWRRRIVARIRANS